MRVPFNDLSRRPAPDAAVRRVLERGWYLHGPETEAFEREFAAWCGTGHAVGVASGTDALEIALRAAGIAPGDEVATVANAGLYSTCAVRATGAQPLYIDIDPERMLLDPAALDRAIGPATRAVIATHLFGRMAPMPEVLEIAAARDLIVIEDCAQAHGAELRGRKAGAWGLAGCFSFYPTKNLGACGDAGAIVTSDAELAARIRSLGQYGWKAKYDSALPGGRNSRIDELQAAVLRQRLSLLNADNCRRRRIIERYNAALAACPGLAAPGGAALDDVGHLYVVRSARRDQLRAWLDQRGIRAEIHYPIPDPDQASQRGLPSRFGPDGLPVTRRVSREILSLPCFPELRDEEIDAVTASILEWCPPT
jgi:dTDP-4-amino-4,6-dideoxygalactose transaminase